MKLGMLFLGGNLKVQFFSPKKKTEIKNLETKGKKPYRK
jgi:hypothetical protein